MHGMEKQEWGCRLTKMNTVVPVIVRLTEGSKVHLRLRVGTEGGEEIVPQTDGRREGERDRKETLKVDSV